MQDRDSSRRYLGHVYSNPKSIGSRAEGIDVMAVERLEKVDHGMHPVHKNELQAQIQMRLSDQYPLMHFEPRSGQRFPGKSSQKAKSKTVGGSNSKMRRRLKSSIAKVKHAGTSGTGGGDSRLSRVPFSGSGLEGAHSECLSGVIEQYDPNYVYRCVTGLSRPRYSPEHAWLNRVNRTPAAFLEEQRKRQADALDLCGVELTYASNVIPDPRPATPRAIGSLRRMVERGELRGRDLPVWGRHRGEPNVDCRSCNRWGAEADESVIPVVKVKK